MGLHMVPLIGSGMRYAISTHCHFNIGIIRSNPKRQVVLTYLKMTWNQWLNKHPIPKPLFDDIKQEVLGFGKIGNPWKPVKNHEEMKKYWSNELINRFKLSDFGIMVKGGGEGNFFKAKHALYQSKPVLKLL